MHSLQWTASRWTADPILISSAIPGVTFQLLSTSRLRPIQVVIANDNTDVTNAFQTFVTAYNKVLGDLTTQEGNDCHRLARAALRQSDRVRNCKAHLLLP